MKKVFSLVLIAAVCLPLINAVSAKQMWHRCDVNQDSKIDVKDVAIAVRVYSSYFSDSKKNRRFDFDRDGEVSFKDIALIAKYFGIRRCIKE